MDEGDPRAPTLREEPIDALAGHGLISIAFAVESVLDVVLVDGGLGGLWLRESAVPEPWVKDYDADDGEGPSRWAGRFDVALPGDPRRDTERERAGVPLLREIGLQPGEHRPLRLSGESRRGAAHLALRAPARVAPNTPRTTARERGKSGGSGGPGRHRLPGCRLPRQSRVQCRVASRPNWLGGRGEK